MKLSMGHPEDALCDCAVAIGVAPDDARSYEAAAYCVLSGCDVAQPGRLRDALPADVNASGIERGIASALAETGEYEAAVARFTTLLHRYPGDQTGMRLLAEMYTGLREWPAALHWFEKATAEGVNLLASIGLVLHWSRFGDFEQARHVYRTG